MKKYIKILIAIIIIIIIVIAFTSYVKTNQTQNNKEFKIVASFYPIHIMLLNITDGANNVSVENLTNQNIGCIHNYTLTTKDLIKLESANAFIVSGNGLENNIIEKIKEYDNLAIIDSSKKIDNGQYIKENDEVNAHIWTSLAIYKEQVRNITDELCKLNSENKDIYIKNSNNYIEKINKLIEKEELIKNKQTNIKAISFSDSLVYLYNELNIETLDVHTHHEESTLSAENLSKIVEQAKNENINIVFIDKNEENKNVSLIKNEINAKVYILDSGIRGSNDKDAYINAMNNNLEIISKL